MIVDVMPYYEWGNEENDTTPFLDRVAGPESDPELYSKIKNFYQPADPWENIQKKFDKFVKKYSKNH